MEFKVSSSMPSPVIRVIGGFSNTLLEESLFSKNILISKVMERLVGNEYLLTISGKPLKLFSEVKLFPGETLHLNVKKEESRIKLEILSRSMNSGGTSLDIEKVWTKSYFSPLKAANTAMESNQKDLSFQKLYQFLDVFFPGIEWNQSVSQFEWKFKDGEANGFFGKKKDSFGFYFHFESILSGVVDSYIKWKKEDFSDVIIHCVFDRLSTYLHANEKLFELKKILSSELIFAHDIIFHYSTLEIETGKWVT